MILTVPELLVCAYNFVPSGLKQMPYKALATVIVVRIVLFNALITVILPGVVLCATKILLPSALTTIPFGLLLNGMVAITAFVAANITLKLPVLELVTYTLLLFGLNATPEGPLPTGTDVMIVFVTRLTTETAFVELFGINALGSNVEFRSSTKFNL
jgi:hypothetical protein